MRRFRPARPLRQKNRENADSSLAEVFYESAYGTRNIFECMLVVGLWIDVVRQCKPGINPPERIRNPENPVRPRVRAEHQAEVSEQGCGFVPEEKPLQPRSYELIMRTGAQALFDWRLGACVPVEQHLRAAGGAHI